MEKYNKQQYLDEGGVKCPYCGNDNLECETITTDDNFIHRKVNCHVCGKTWLDVYTLTDILLEN